MNRRKVGQEHQAAKRDLKTQRTTWSGSKYIKGRKEPWRRTKNS